MEVSIGVQGSGEDIAWLIRCIYIDAPDAIVHSEYDYRRIYDRDPDPNEIEARLDDGWLYLTLEYPWSHEPVVRNAIERWKGRAAHPWRKEPAAEPFSWFAGTLAIMRGGLTVTGGLWVGTFVFAYAAGLGTDMARSHFETASLGASTLALWFAVPCFLVVLMSAAQARLRMWLVDRARRRVRRLSAAELAKRKT